MAYLDLSSELANARAHVAQGSSKPFTVLEEEVISISKLDTLNTVLEPSRLTRWLRAVTAAKVSPPLADRRLEALRRFAVLARLGGRKWLGGATSEAHDAGYSDWQLAKVREAVGARS
ncbi:hypothetical protein [Sphingomonas xinjiangensis]|uniref:Uncharacterized protein n=1 Tax=Sphingomonas xinjiangensis TaxID=643568 RepID=A0A840YS41_9SPHN|nr:hypothetical protein [Sphingomonas xinjiangensis]MBB5712496.1 hypothetical protein [Sphingomonas xinjiangensis]